MKNVFFATALIVSNGRRRVTRGPSPANSATYGVHPGGAGGPHRTSSKKVSKNFGLEDIYVFQINLEMKELIFIPKYAPIQRLHLFLITLPFVFTIKSESASAMEDLQAEMKLLNWHKLANEAALKVSMRFFHCI